MLKNASSKAIKNRMTEQIDNYEAAFKSIQESTQVKDVETMVKIIVEAEDQDYHLTAQINDLSVEVEKLESDNFRLKSEIEKYIGQGERSSQNRLRIKEGLENHIEEMKKKMEELQEEIKGKEAVQEALKVITKSALDKVGCTNEKIVIDINANGVNNENFMTLLGIVEQRSLEICKLLVIISSSGAPSVPPIAKGSEVSVPQVD